jgi:hypothetical protein
LAKTPITAPVAPQKSLIPVSTDPRSELYFLLGRLQGSGYDGADRITVLVTELTQAVEPAPGVE